MMYPTLGSKGAPNCGEPLSPRGGTALLGWGLQCVRGCVKRTRRAMVWGYLQVWLLCQGPECREAEDKPQVFWATSL